MLLMFFITFLCLVCLRKFISFFNWSHYPQFLENHMKLFHLKCCRPPSENKSCSYYFLGAAKNDSLMTQSNQKNLWSKCSAIMFQLSPQNVSFFSRMQGKPSIWCQTAWRLLMCMKLTRLLPKATILMNFCFSILSQRNISSPRFLISLCELLLLFAASDANWGSSGGSEGHLRAAVVVQFACVCAAYHSSVRVPSSVRVSVPETPDVTLWADRWNRVESGILNVHSQRDQYNVISLNHIVLNDNTLSLPLLHTKKEILAAVRFCFFVGCWATLTRHHSSITALARKCN